MFYENFIKLCATRGLYPTNVGTEIGLNPATVNGWKNGAVPRDITLHRIAGYFGVTVDWLLADHTDDEPIPTDALAESDTRPHFDMAVYTALFGYGDAQELTDADKADVEFAVELIKARLKARRENKL